ncbi:MAG: hypothetical protein IJQ98_11590 [Oscillospiraceae bacterium]|nr:hypothetical protein [Oscillospiraceae bacterium]MBR0313019.1 hypothetical protein [Oscillospiraceae bacterium]
MYALEKHSKNGWRRYAVCERRKPLDKVRKAMRDAKRWRVVYVFGSVAELPAATRAA